MKSLHFRQLNKTKVKAVKQNNHGKFLSSSDLNSFVEQTGDIKLAPYAGSFRKV